MIDLDEMDITEDLISEMNEDNGAVESLQVELEQLVGASLSVAQYGINPTALGILQSTNLLCGTALDRVGLESFTYDEPEGEQTALALESLGDKIKEKGAALSAKLLQKVKNLSTRVMGAVTTTWDKIESLLETLAQKSWSGAKGVAATVKAHPYKTVIGVVGAIGAVAGIMMYCGSNLPGANATNETIVKFSNKVRDMVNAIRSPFGKIEAVVTPAGNVKLLTHMTGPGSPSYKDPIMEQVNAWSKSEAMSLKGILKTLRTKFTTAFSLLIKGFMFATEVFSHVINKGANALIRPSTKHVISNTLNKGGSGIDALGNAMMHRAKWFPVAWGVSYATVMFIYGLTTALVYQGLFYIKRTIRDLISSNPEPKEA